MYEREKTKAKAKVRQKQMQILHSTATAKGNSRFLHCGGKCAARSTALRVEMTRFGWGTLLNKDAIRNYS